MILIDAYGLQIFTIDFKQKVRLSASSDAGNNLDHTVLFFIDQFVEISLTLYHSKRSFRQKCF